MRTMAVYLHSYYYMFVCVCVWLMMQMQTYMRWLSLEMFVDLLLFSPLSALQILCLRLCIL